MWYINGKIVSLSFAFGEGFFCVFLRNFKFFGDNYFYDDVLFWVWNLCIYCNYRILDDFLFFDICEIIIY